MDIGALSITSLTLAFGFGEMGLGLVIGLVGGFFLNVLISKKSFADAKREAEQIKATARTEGEAEKHRLELEAEKQATKRREVADAEIAELRAEIKQSQTRLDKREDTLDEKLSSLTKREDRLDKRDNKLAAREAKQDEDEQSLARSQSDLRERLEKLANLSEAAAREIILQEVREEADHEANVLTQRVLEEADEQARSRSREITLMAVQRYAADHVSEQTVRSVRIPSDDMKGRIIGREGRNIRALERATGVDILVDDTPGVIAVSCFDPIRRAIAGEALQRLVKDGRVHPSRIEEVAEQVQKEMQERIIKAGNDAIMEVNLRGVKPKVIEAMGKLSLRTSYGQNVLRHSIEVAFLCQLIADQLGLDGTIARRCGFLHDIGKAMDHEMEGGHPAIGMEFCRKHGEKAEAVLNAVGGHHSDIPATTPYTAIVQAADALSGARPGARRESMEMYIKRLEQLEGIAKEKKFVEEAHAIQAGREVRVIVDAKRATDADAHAIARSIAAQVESEMTFPGEIKVTVLRETRANATAR